MFQWKYIKSWWAFSFRSYYTKRGKTATSKSGSRIHFCPTKAKWVSTVCHI